MTGREVAWEQAPCGLLTLRLDGTVTDVNETFLTWAGRTRAEVVDRVRFADLLSVGGRIYWETHLSPMLHVDGRVAEVALEVRAPHGRLPVLVSAMVHPADPPEVLVSVAGARERSRYERELVAARRASDRAAGRTRVLQTVTSALSAAVGTDGVTAALLGSAASLGAGAATLWLADAEDRLTACAAVGEEALAAPRPVARGGPVRTEGDRVVVPLQGPTRLHGILSLAPDRSAAADPVDLDVVGAVGQQAGVALDRARLHEQSTSIAHQLQQSLLAADPPRDRRLAVTTTYRPGVQALEVGGDWYDAFEVERDRLAVVVGDVVGRGLGAAVAMGQLRSAVRAVASPGAGPAGVLRRLDRFVGQVEGATSATLAYVEVDLRTGRARYACAGHMPPLLAPAGDAPRLLWDGRSTPLGVVLPDRARGEAELHLAPGDRLVLFTDGLVERRDRSLREGLDAVGDHATEVRDQPVEQAVRLLTDRLLDGESGHDDVCVLMMEWRGA